ATKCGRDAEANTPLGGKLEGVGKQALQHLLQPLRVGIDASPEMGIDRDIEGELAVFGFVAEWPYDGLQEVGGEDVLCLHRPRARFDLRKIENVADQVQQVGAGTVNRAGKFDLLDC